MNQGTLQIGEVARRAGVNIRTLHYYEGRGLLPNPRRSPSNYRLYTEDAVRRVRFVKHAQELGFTLEEIKELLALRIDSRATCANVRARTEDKIHAIEGKVKALHAMRRALERLAAACSGGGSVSDCPILEALDREEKKR